jgi:hypothetical protein
MTVGRRNRLPHQAASCSLGLVAQAVSLAMRRRRLKPTLQAKA